MPVKPVTEEEVLKKALDDANEDWQGGGIDKGSIHVALEAMDSWASLQTAERDERILELEAGLKELIKAIDAFQPKIDVENKKQVAIYTARHTATQLLNPTGVNEKE